MKDYFSSGFKIGILGGGQLGKMLIQAASCWDIDIYVLDPTEGCPASNIATKFIKGDFKDFDDVYNFGKQVDLITIEIEHVNTEALLKLKEEGKTICPDPDILKIIQDKGKQKNFFKNNNLRTANYKLYFNQQTILNDLDYKKLKTPFVQKACRFGYDGRGVQIVKNKDDLENLFDGQSVIEDKVDIKKELSVIVARNHSGEIKSYVPFEMEFNEQANLVENLISPARIDNKSAKQAIKLAEQTIETFGLVGVLAVEMFLDKENNILINEVAPRPHNSGHHTIETALTSQYEQHIRAILDLPLGSTELISSAVMVNILGEDGFSGQVRYEGLDKCVGIDGVKIHIYGKKQTKPFRKMGHATIIDKDIDEAIKKAEMLKLNLRAVS
ncbi:MAG: 5-(carboxyamino)imidazole ribonucleotide synthase [Candidatus Dadabacteria bacterium]|nr:5-(carboxyamino)imidazole ribonucleotide synthase [Candidatus Dadabacteria bacterium]NIX15248.1 5-(carboxyamino)imidazole ribonucleotide synthase [Candidatus Dadabacteria bacterium]